MSKKIGVLLSGCGYLDGAEIREAVLTLLALDKDGVEVSIFAPNEGQHHVVNHLEADESKNEKRNTFIEAARIARGQITPLENVKSDELDGLVIPGGYGVAKNLCEFAFKGHQATTNEKVKNLINSPFISCRIDYSLLIQKIIEKWCLNKPSSRPS